MLALGISQSGETADTALGDGGGAGARRAAVRRSATCSGSQATRISEGVIYTHAGPEIGVASTKAFTTQLVALYLLALYLRQARGLGDRAPSCSRALAHLPQAVDEALAPRSSIDELARRYFRAAELPLPRRAASTTRSRSKGALKLKEISYIHAEGYPAGEMKHGPIALIDENLPVVVDRHRRPGLREGQEQPAGGQGARRRGDRRSPTATPRSSTASPTRCIRCRACRELLQPIVNVVPLQLLAYHIGVRRGADVDQPRNLAKSVTVE